MYYYINIFLVYSVLGYIYESLYSFVRSGKFRSGIMYGPWTPVYGVGVIIIILLSRYLFKKMHLNKFYEIIIFLIIITIILTFIEWLGGVFIDKLFHKTLWDYSDQKFHIGKYISLTASLTWAVGSLLVVYVINPLVEDYIIMINPFISIIFFIIFICDFIATFINNLRV